MSTNPFQIGGPALVSFSGGRTSALMLRRILDAGIDEDVHVCFANTGKEREETLEFVHEVEERWNVGITWLERDDGTMYDHHDAGDEEPRRNYRVVSYKTASRSGEPFRQLILDRNYMPNPVTRFCTTELKISVMKGWMRDQGYEHWSNIVGLRADEPRRVARMREQNSKQLQRWQVSMPLAEAGIGLADVNAFWREQPFQLGLRPWEGNCDLCYLKGHKKRERIIRDRPDLAPGVADWAVPPDIVAGGAASLALSLRWLPWVLRHCPRALLAVQDGMTVDQIRPYLGKQVGVFIGGTTEWKLATMDAWASLARQRGAWCHVARVNTLRRIHKCAIAGATSFDGTSASRYAIRQPSLGQAVAQQFFDWKDS